MSNQVSILRKKQCPDCSGTTFIEDHDIGEVICNTCGLVVDEKNINEGAEWRAYTLEERARKARTGSPASLIKFDKGLSTTFQPYKDGYGKPLSMKDRLRMMRLQKWQIRTRVHSSAHRNLSQAMNKLTLLSDKLHIPKDVEENAAHIYRKAFDKGLVRGRSIESAVAASLYAACRLTRTTRSLTEIVNASSRSRKEISRHYRMLQRELDLKIPIDDPFKYVSKIGSKIGINQQVQQTAVKLLHKAKQKKTLSGKDPIGLAAAAIYIACKLNIIRKTQKEIAIAANITEVTIRNRYKSLIKTLKLDL
ncbi:MAG: transcription initiation factor IIB [Candidatus Bathyarchaeota archaeon]|nr:MAG: transcription initiation factor IIB [Candidatus Bathyarchaeota archaeon]